MSAAGGLLFIFFLIFPPAVAATEGEEESLQDRNFHVLPAGQPPSGGPDHEGGAAPHRYDPGALLDAGRRDFGREHSGSEVKTHRHILTHKHTLKHSRSGDEGPQKAFSDKVCAEPVQCHSLRKIMT